jgi:hypothetical protein
VGEALRLKLLVLADPELEGRRRVERRIPAELVASGS